MARPSILQRDTKLYSPAEPDGRVFLAGESWPGDAWSDDPDPQAATKAADAEGATLLAATLKEVGELRHNIEGMKHSLAQQAAELSKAKEEVGLITQAAADAETAKSAAMQEAQEAVRARDQAIADASGYRQRAEALTEKAEADKATIERLTRDLAKANQKAASRDEDRTRIMELETDLANANAEISKMDPDGSGKVGGRAKKAASGDL